MSPPLAFRRSREEVLGDTRRLTRWSSRTLWREWRHCEDEEWSERLYEVLSGRSVGVLAPLGLIAGWALALGLAASSTWTAAWLWPDHRGRSDGEAWALTGMVIGALLGLRLWCHRRKHGAVSWGEWLSFAMPDRLGAGIDVRFPPGVAACAFAVMIALWRGPEVAYVTVPVVIALGILWYTHGSGAVVGIPLAGVIGHLAGLAYITTLGEWERECMAAAILGMVVAAGIGILSVHVPRARDREAIFRSRGSMLWWARRPEPRHVLRSLRAFPGEPWVSVVAMGEKARKGERRLDRAIDWLLRGSWPQKLVAAVELEEDRGRSAFAIADALQGARGEESFGRHVVRQLARSEREWGRAAGIGERGPHGWVCSRCHVRASRVRPLRSGLPRDRAYVGCRRCGSARSLVPIEGSIRAVLDDRWAGDEVTEVGADRVVSWLHHRRPFDYDSVTILHASDADVEAFAIQAANVEDAVRQARIARVRCEVSPRCELDPNTIAVLERTFGEVVVAGAEPPAGPGALAGAGSRCRGSWPRSSWGWRS